MQNRVNNRNTFIFILIILQPILDMVTSLSTYVNGNSLTVGSLAKTLIMFGLTLFIIPYLAAKHRVLLVFYVCTVMSILLMLLINFIQKENFIWMAEINFALKTGYYVTMVFIGIIMLHQRLLSKAFINQAIKVVSVIIGVSYWIAIGTRTSINSYSYDAVGFAGWFYSANELSVIVLILIGLLLANLTYDKTVFTWIAFLLIISMVPMIGTKTAFYGGIILLLSYGIYLLFTFNWRNWRAKQNRSTFLYMGVIILLLCFIPFTPIATNTNEGPTLTEEQIHLQNNATESDSLFIRKILSSRNVYFQAIKEDFIHAGGWRKAFGLGYAGDYTTAPKVIEMDFFDLFFSYGIIGSFILLLPGIYFTKRIVSFPISIEKGILALTLCLCLGVSFLAGHVLFAPSVMTYIAILLVGLGLSSNE